MPVSEWVECPVGKVEQIQGHKPSVAAKRYCRRRPLDLLGVWHKELEVFFLTGKQAGIQPIHAKRLREMLTALNAAAGPF